MLTGPPPKFHGSRDNLGVEWFSRSHSLRVSIDIQSG
jgi:hypothetical protein